MRKSIVEIGKKYNKLTIIKEAEMRRGETHVLSKCDCGKNKISRLSQLKNGTTKSCGCLIHLNLSEKGRKSLAENARKTFWKGDKAGYEGKHVYIHYKYGKASKCENPKCVYPRMRLSNRKIMEAPKRYEWANISGKYRRDMNDWMQLCPSCHRFFDNGSLKIKRITSKNHVERTD